MTKGEKIKELEAGLIENQKLIAEFYSTKKSERPKRKDTILKYYEKKNELKTNLNLVQQV